MQFFLELFLKVRLTARSWLQRDNDFTVMQVTVTGFCVVNEQEN